MKKVLELGSRVRGYAPHTPFCNPTATLAPELDANKAVFDGNMRK